MWRREYEHSPLFVARFFLYLCGTLDNGKTLIGNIWDFKN